MYLLANLLPSCCAGLNFLNCVVIDIMILLIRAIKSNSFWILSTEENFVIKEESELGVTPIQLRHISQMKFTQDRHSYLAHRCLQLCSQQKLLQKPLFVYKCKFTYTLHKLRTTFVNMYPTYCP